MNNFHEAFLCSSLLNRNDECLDSPPRSAESASAVVVARSNKEQQHEKPPRDDEEEEGDGEILQRSRARREERAQFLKECELMMIKTTIAKNNLLGTPTPTSTPLPVGPGAVSLRLKKLWDFSNENDTNDNVEQQRPQQRDDEHETKNNDNDVQENDMYNEDDDENEKLWPSTKIRRESRRYKLGLQTMREKQELNEVEQFVAEMRKKRMVRVEERQKQNHLLTLQQLDDGPRKNKDVVVAEEEMQDENKGINRDNDDDVIVVDDLEEYTAIRNTEIYLSSPRDARLQLIRKWKEANSTNHHFPTTTSASTHIVSSASPSSHAMNTSTAEDAEEKGTFNEVDSNSNNENHTSLSDSELKRWWNEHKRSTNHIQMSMPSFEELVDEPTITTSKKRPPHEQPQIGTTSMSTAMRIEQLRCRRKGGRGEHPPHPEDSTSAPNNNSMHPDQKAKPLPEIGSSIASHTIDDGANTAQSTLTIMQGRLEEAKIKFAEAAEKSRSSSSSKGQKDANDEEQAALAELIERLGEAVVTMKQLDQY